MRVTARSRIIGTLAVALIAAALAPGTSAGYQSTQAGSVGPPILRVARASELAAINRAEAQREAASSYSPPAGARYSSADTDAYAAFAHPVAAPILRVARASELAAIRRAEAQREAASSYSPPAGARYSSAVLDAYATLAHPPVAASAPTVKAPGDGFDFGAAAVGAGFAVAIIVLITAGGLVMRRRRQAQYG